MKKKHSVKQKITALICLMAITACITGSAFAQSTDYSIKSNYNTISKNLENLRSLPFKKKVPYSMQTKDRLREILKKALKEELSGPRFKAYDAFLKAFGFVPKNFDTWKFLLELYSDEVAGMYDPKSKSLLLVQGGVNMKGMEQQEVMLKMYGLDMGNILLIHEMQHAIQDQYFNIFRIIENTKKKNNDDYEIAVQSLIEGDATIIMMYYALDKIAGGIGVNISGLMDMSTMKSMMGDNPMHGNSQVYARAPLYFKKSLLFPYIDGMIFVEELKKAGGWNQVNMAFHRLPKSTEQIIHPQKYISRENPIQIQWSNLPKNTLGWNAVATNTAGEFTISVLFEHFVPDSDYNSIAEGWGGDRYRIYEQGKDTFFAWLTNWDTKEDAMEFFNSYRYLLRIKYPSLTWTKNQKNRAYLGTVNGKYIYTAISGRNVAVLEEVPSDLIGAFVQYIWKAKLTYW